MIREELLNPLAAIGEACEGLLDETNGMLNVAQERVVSSVYDVTRQLHDLIISLPDMEMTSVQTLLSYETRSHLTSIIGYAEVLLDETDGPLTVVQANLARSIHSNGRYVLTVLTDLLNNN